MSYLLREMCVKIKSLLVLLQIFGHLIENKELPLEILEELEGRYPKKALDNLRRNLKDE